MRALTVDYVDEGARVCNKNGSADTLAYARARVLFNRSRDKGAMRLSKQKMNQKMLVRSMTGLVAAMILWRTANAIAKASLEAFAYLSPGSADAAVMVLSLDGSVFATFTHDGQIRARRGTGKVMDSDSVGAINRTANMLLESMIGVARQLYNGSGA